MHAVVYVVNLVNCSLLLAYVIVFFLNYQSLHYATVIYLFIYLLTAAVAFSDC